MDEGDKRYEELRKDVRRSAKEMEKEVKKWSKTIKWYCKGINEFVNLGKELIAYTTIPNLKSKEKLNDLIDKFIRELEERLTKDQSLFEREDTILSRMLDIKVKLMQVGVREELIDKMYEQVKKMILERFAAWNKLKKILEEVKERKQKCME